jgi:hypothetical protein
MEETGRRHRALDPERLEPPFTAANSTAILRQARWKCKDGRLAAAIRAGKDSIDGADYQA